MGAVENTDQDTVDLAIVGAGPTGLFAAYYAGFRGMSMALIDALPEPGGQVTALYPEKLIFDVAGFPAIRGRDLVGNLVQQAAPYEPRYFLGERAAEVAESAEHYVLRLSDRELAARAVLITAGIGEFHPRRLPAGEEWLGRGVVHFVPELAAHSGQDVVIVGGGDSAFDWALSLHPLARSVTLVHRRAKFRAHEGLVQQVRDLGIPLVTEAEVTEVRGQHWVREVEVSMQDGSRRVLPAQTVVAALGFVANLGALSAWGLDLEKRTILVDSTLRTNRERIYAAGDVANYPGKVKLIATGFGEAATAVNNAAVALNPKAHLFPGHSTEQS